MRWGWPTAAQACLVAMSQGRPFWRVSPSRWAPRVMAPEETTVSRRPAPAAASSLASRWQFSRSKRPAASVRVPVPTLTTRRRTRARLLLGTRPSLPDAGPAPYFGQSVPVQTMRRGVAPVVAGSAVTWAASYFDGSWPALAAQTWAT